MKILFVHQNFPGQYLHLARFLARDPANQVVAISQSQGQPLPGVQSVVYKPQRTVARTQHHYLADTEAAILNGQEVTRAALKLRDSGFRPDVMAGHNGWGEIWFLKDVYPDVPLLGYFEFFYHLRGTDVDFDPDAPPAFDDGPRIRSKNIGNLLGLDTADWGQCPTQWQRSLYPKHYQSMLQTVHEGVDTEQVIPDPAVSITLRKAEITLKAGDEVVTYVARNLEPHRGFPSFMRALPAVLAKRPNAHVLIVGGDDVSYGRRPTDAVSFKEKMIAEVGGSLDLSRVHFLGRVPYSSFLKLLQVSRAHVYLTYPFVLSWSMLEAMSAGCLVVGSRTPPVEEVIRDGINGLLVDFFSPPQIADRVVEALEDRTRYQELRRNARQTVVEQFDLQTVCLPAQLLLFDRVARRFA